MDCWMNWYRYCFARRYPEDGAADTGAGDISETAKKIDLEMMKNINEKYKRIFGKTDK